MRSLKPTLADGAADLLQGPTEATPEFVRIGRLQRIGDPFLEFVRRLLIESVARVVHFVEFVHGFELRRSV